MKTTKSRHVYLISVSIVAGLLVCLDAQCAEADSSVPVEVGIAVRDITPPIPIWLAGYAARTKAAEKIEIPLVVEAIAFKSGPSDPFIFVSLDNCEVSHSFMAPALQKMADQYHVKPGAVMVISSHTHSAPVLTGALETMYNWSEAEHDQVVRYSDRVREQIVEVVGAALADLQPALLEQGKGQATFAINRRVYRADQIGSGGNPDAPVNWDVPVLRIKGTNQVERAVIFGYACHGTSMQGDDFYVICGDYMAFARRQLEAVHPGVVAFYFTGMGADSNPFPRGQLLNAKRHGLELAGAVEGVLDRPMTPVHGPLRWAYSEVELPFMPSPRQEQLEKDAQNKDIYIARRAAKFLALLKDQKPLPVSIKLPMASVRLGSDLTFIAMAGETVADYGLHFRRAFAADHPWMIGYAYEVPCYIPSIRIIKEGGYEPDTSLIYYGYYGPFQTSIEDLIYRKAAELMNQSRTD